MSIVREWRALEPPGRFLKRDNETGLWYDIGDVDARVKCSQILREHKSTKLKLDEYGNSYVSTSTASTNSSRPQAPRKQAAKQPTQKQLPRKRSLSRQQSNKHTNRKKFNRVDSITTDSDEGQPSSQSSSMTSEPRQDEPNALALEWDRILTSFEEEYAKRNNSTDNEVPINESTDKSSQQAMPLPSLESTAQSSATSLTTQSTTKPPSEEQAIPVRTTQLQCSQYPLATVKMAKLRRPKHATYNDEEEAEKETTTAELLDNINMNDVLMGANYNSHPGNIQFFKALSMFDDFSAVSDCFVNALESLNPPGRFMGKDKLNNCWESLDNETAIELVPYLADSYTQNSNGDECSSAFLVSVQQFLEAKQEGGTDSNGSISELTDPTYQKAVLPQTSPIPREVDCSPKRSSASKKSRKFATTSLRIGTSTRHISSQKRKRVAEKGKSLALSAALSECEDKNEVTDSSARDSISYETYAEA